MNPRAAEPPTSPGPVAAWLVLAVGLGCAGCTTPPPQGDEPSSLEEERAAHKPATIDRSITVDIDGAAIKRARLTVPGGNALGVDEFTISHRSRPPSNGWQPSPLDAVHIGPSGTRFSPTASLTFEYDEAALRAAGALHEAFVRVAVWNETLRQWQPVETESRSLSANTVTAQLEHLSTYALIVPTIYPPTKAAGSKPPVLLVHGIQKGDVGEPLSGGELESDFGEPLGTFGQLSPSVQSSLPLTDVPIYEIRYYTGFNIAGSACALKWALHNIVEWHEPSHGVRIIAHSMGGLVARAYIQGFGEYDGTIYSKTANTAVVSTAIGSGTTDEGIACGYAGDVRQVMTLATPHGGSTSAALWLVDAEWFQIDSTDELLAGSSFLKNLNAAKPEPLLAPVGPHYISYWGDEDALVEPVCKGDSKECFDHELGKCKDYFNVTLGSCLCPAVCVWSGSMKHNLSATGYSAIVVDGDGGGGLVEGASHTNDSGGDIPIAQMYEDHPLWDEICRFIGACSHSSIAGCGLECAPAAATPGAEDPSTTLTSLSLEPYVPGGRTLYFKRSTGSFGTAEGFVEFRQGKGGPFLAEISSWTPTEVRVTTNDSVFTLPTEVTLKNVQGDVLDRRWFPFTDTREGDWAGESIVELWKAGVVQGVPEGTKQVFDRERSTSRGEFVKMVVFASNSKKGCHLLCDDLPFTDVPDTKWYFDSIEVANDREWLDCEPFQGTTFEPDEPITRAEVACILSNALGLKPASTYKLYSDVKDPSAWYWDSVYRVQNPVTSSGKALETIMAGYKNGDFGPMDPTPREQMAKVIYFSYYK